MRFSNVKTQDLEQLEGIQGIGHARFKLYDGPLGVTKEKKEDLLGLSAYLPEQARAEYADLLVAAAPADAGAETDSDSEGDVE